LLLVQPELLAPPLATLPVPRLTLLPAGHPLPLPLLRRAHERAGAGVGGSDFAALTLTICRGQEKP
jgi:hypothetical protein